MNKHILVISQCFYPQQFRINDICVEWIKRGYKVTVIAGIPNTSGGQYYKGYGLFKKVKENYNGINIIRIPVIPRGNNSIMLALNYLSFVISGFFWSIFTKTKADIVFIFQISPMTQALPGMWYAKRKKIPCHIYVQDLWPETIEAVTSINNKYIIKSIGKMADYIYKRCTYIFTTSKSFIKPISERGIRIENIKYWPQYPEGFYKVLGKRNDFKIPDDGRYNITFTGNIGKAQGLEILPKIALLIKEKDLHNDIRFNIVGDGRYKEELIKSIQSIGLLDIFNFIPEQDPTKIPGILASSDVAFLCLKNEALFEMTVPAKLQSYMACGMPILASVAGETKRAIEESGSGLCSLPGDEQGLYVNIMRFLNMTNEELNVLARSSKEYCDKNFNKEELLNMMDRYLKDEYEWGKINMFKDRTLLITGGTGSFGNAIMKRLLDEPLKEIRIFSRDEKKQDDMRRRYKNDKLKFYIGDVRDLASVKNAMHGVDYTFHAAALKQVPSCEFFPLEAVKTNILGTDNVLTAAVDMGVKKVICLSTDKAAYPINAMGISKAMMEKVIIAKSRTADPNKTLICCTRYGNVMASRGSVIPLFIEQIKSGKDLTITDPNMTRFLMNLADAVDLVIFAFKNANTGDIMVQKSPASTVGDLSQALKELFNADNKVNIIGTRHGEKQYETLLTREEYLQSEDLGDFYRIPADKRDLNYDKYYLNGDKEVSMDNEYNSNNTETLNVEQIKEKLLELDYINSELKGWDQL